MGIRGEKQAVAGEKSVEGAVGPLWKRAGVMPAVPAVPALHRSCPPDIHISTRGKIYPSVIFLRMSSRLRLNAWSSPMSFSILSQAEMAVV